MPVAEAGAPDARDAALEALAPWDDGFCKPYENPPGSPITRIDDGAAWALSFRSNAKIGDIDVDEAGGIVTAGVAYGAFDVDGQAVDLPLGFHAYVVQLTPEGHHVWSRVLPTFGLPAFPRVARVRGGGAVVVLRFQHEFGLDGRTYDAITYESVGVVSLDAAGVTRWASVFPSAPDTRTPDVAVDSAGNAYLAGNVGGGDASSSGGEAILKLDPAGAVLARWSFASTAEQRVLQVAIDSEDRVVVAGAFSDTLTIGGTVLQATGFGAAAAFVAKLDGVGAPQWAVALDGKYDATSVRLALGPGDAVAVAGGFAGQFGVPGDLHESTGYGSDVFAARLSPTGETEWRVAFGADRGDVAFATAMGEDGSVTVGGEIWGQVQVGPSLLDTGYIRDGFAATYDAAGQYRASAVFDSSAVSQVASLAYAPGGALVVAGTFDCAIALPLGTLWGGDETGFVMKVPDGLQ